MKQNRRCAAWLLALVLLLAGCTGGGQQGDTDSGQPAEETSDAAQVAEYITREELIDGLASAEKSWTDLTTGQYLEDLDSLYRDMQENYPYFGVVRRMIGVDIDALYAETRAALETCDNDYDFLVTVRDFIRALDYAGHISLWAPRGYFMNTEFWLEEAEGDDWMADFARPYAEVLDNPASPVFYGGLQDLLAELDEQVEQYNLAVQEARSEHSDPNDDPDEPDCAEPPPNVETRIVEEGRIAYVRIDSFPGRYDDDAEVLLPFYRAVADYDHLIFDITQNGGGGMNYYQNLMAGPLIKEPLEVDTFLLTKGGEINRRFMDLDDWQPTSQIPDLPELNMEDVQEMDLFESSAYTVWPNDPEESVDFSGRVWLLVSEHNYSASEYAAFVSKYSGFATLVGQNTGGDGIGREPVPIVLPNSGLVVQYSPIHGLTAEGRGSEEFGTAPDIASPEGETALETCLRVIGELAG